MKLIFIVYAILLAPLFFMTYLENVYATTISSMVMVEYFVILSVFFCFLISGYQLKIKPIPPAFGRLMPHLIGATLVVLVCGWVYVNVGTLRNVGLLYSLAGEGVGAANRVDASGTIRNWFSISLVAGIILPLYFRLTHNSYYLQIIASGITLLGGSKFIFFTHIMTISFAGKKPLKTLLLGVFIVFGGLSIFALMKGLSIFDVPENFARRLILIPGFICMLKLQNRERLTEFADIGRDAYQFIWFASGDGAAPSLIMFDFYVVYGLVGLFLGIFISFGLGVYLRATTTFCGDRNVEPLVRLPMLLIIYSSSIYLFLKLLVIALCLNIFAKDRS